jgi:AcrR family transcriptional regulator
VTTRTATAPRRRPPRPRPSPTPDLDARRRILRGALEVFAARGFDGARTRDIAAAAGVNLGLLQYYFGGKEKLWRAAVDHAFGELWRALDVLAASAPVDAAQLPDMIRVAVRFAAGQPALIRLMNDEGKREGPRLRWLVEHHGRRLFETLQSGFALSGAKGPLAGVDPVLGYFVFVGALGMLFSQAPECRLLSGKDPTASPDMVEAHADLLVRLFLG